MGVTKFPNGLSARGGVELFGNTRSDLTVGSVYFVDSGHADANDVLGWGTDITEPFATLDFAIGQCTANSGDVIYLLPNHAETLTTADAVDIDVAGVSVIGIGNGTARPTFTYTVAAGEIVIGADNVLVENIVCTSSVTAVLIGIDIEDGVDHAVIRNCEFNVEAANTDEFNATIHFTNDNTSCVVENCIIDMALGGAVAGIHLDADTESIVIRNNRIHGDYSTACIVSDTAISTEMLIENNILQNGDTGGIGTEPCMELAASTGIVANNIVMCNLAANDNAIVGTACVNIGNVYSETVGATVGIADSHAVVT
jgi:hypothetical protein